MKDLRWLTTKIYIVKGQNVNNNNKWKNNFFKKISTRSNQKQEKRNKICRMLRAFRNTVDDNQSENINISSWLLLFVRQKHSKFSLHKGRFLHTFLNKEDSISWLKKI